MSSALPIVLVRLGEPVMPVRHTVGDYSLWFQRAIPEPLGVVDLRDDADELPEAAGYIIMGSPVAVYDPHPWLPRALDAARTLLGGKRPALGVCFGHQLFTVAAGGEVHRNERGVEVGTVQVDLAEGAREDPLLSGFAGGLRVNASHDDTVTVLPAGPRVLGSSERDPHQILRWGEQVWSVQFHPEMRRAETRLAVRWRTPRIVSEGGDPQAVEDAVEEAPDGQRLLENFVAIVRGR
jgi:GMP synthase (glutamine-hydrolysing)